MKENFEKTYRKENIKKLFKAIYKDEFDDRLHNPHPLEMREFVKRNKLGDKILEVACGSGAMFKEYGVTHAIDANKYRLERAKKDASVDVKFGFSENIPYEDETFDTVIILRSIHQTRSVYETLMELNRVLVNNGMLILDLVHDNIDVTSGIPLGPLNFRRVLDEFSFELKEMRDITYNVKGKEHETTLFAASKMEDFDYRNLRKIQLVPNIDGYDVKNYYLDKDWRYR